MLNDLLEEVDVPVVKSRNITVDHLGSKGLSLNAHGIARITMNLKALIRKLWIKYGNPVHTGYQHFPAKKCLSANCNYNKEDTDACDLDILSGLRCKNLNLVSIDHLNINSLRNKFKIFALLVAVNLDILMISKIKLDESCPISQFLIPGFNALFTRLIFFWWRINLIYQGRNSFQIIEK